MIVHMAMAMALVFVTTSIHAVCTALVLSSLSSPAGRRWSRGDFLQRITLVGTIVFVMSNVAYVESAVWALLYWTVGAIPDFEQAIYFSLVTFTTLGYGDVTLGSEWRMLGALEAANGIIMFGWTTALIIGTVQHMLGHSVSNSEQS